MAGGSPGAPVRRVVVEPNGYHLLNVGNLGDVAMLQVATGRLRALWPDPAIEVLTQTPERLARLCPGTTALPAEGRNTYLAAPPPGDWLWRHLPDPALRLARKARFAARERTPADTPTRRFVAAVETADVVFVSGGGGTADVFPWESHTVLDVLDLAMGAGVVTAMMGQGFGPLQDAALRRRARAVLPRVDLIAVRERRTSPGLLRSLGVSMDRVVTTGDDAIAVATGFRASATGGAVIGVNVRIAPYSGVHPGLAAQIGEAVRAAAARHGAGLLAIPISLDRDEADANATIKALGGDIDTGPVSRPEDVVALVARCRVVVTGSYHAAVFALALGIPAVGLAASPYYMDKFSGLAGEFGAGCTVVHVEGNWKGALSEAVDELWAEAGTLRAGLREAADRQVALGEAAYRRLRDIVERR